MTIFNGIRFFNGTPHPINLIGGADFNLAIRKYTGGTEVAVIPPSGVLLNARLNNTPIAELGGGVTITRQISAGCDPLPPEALAADYIICSALYAIAYRAERGEDGVKLLTPRDLVVDPDTLKPMGCLGFALN